MMGVGLDPDSEPSASCPGMGPAACSGMRFSSAQCSSSRSVQSSSAQHSLGGGELCLRTLTKNGVGTPRGLSSPGSSPFFIFLGSVSAC